MPFLFLLISPISLFILNSPVELERCVAIKNQQDFFLIRENLSGHYCQKKDIAFSEELEPIGSFLEPFSGVYDGRGFKLKNTVIKTDNYEGAGIFSVSTGKILNVFVENAFIEGNDLVGGLVGLNKGQIKNSFIFGSVDGFNGIGGIAGQNNGFIENSVFVGSISGLVSVGGVVGQNFGFGDNYAVIARSSSDALVFGDTDVGGIAGAVSRGLIDRSFAMNVSQGVNGIGGLVGHLSLESKIINSYSHSSVLGHSFVGGLIGANSELSGFSEVINSYSAGLVSGSGQGVGGLVGSAYRGEVLVENSYWDTETSSQEQSDGGEGRTTAEMFERENYQGWNFREIWKIENRYPVLRP